MKTATPFTASTQDMAILLNEQLSENQGTTPEGYLICKNVNVSRIGIQYYLGQELGLQDQYNKRVPVYRLPEDVFDTEALQSLESKPLTDDHPQQAVTVQNAGFLSMGHGRNVRHDDKHVIADLVVTNPGLIQGIRDKRKYEISLGYTCQYQPYKDGYRQTNIRINHIAVVESGRAGPKVSIKDKALVSVNRRKKPMDKQQAMATMFAAFAKDASPEDVLAVLPFVTDATPEAPVKPVQDSESNKGLLALLAGILSKDAKPAVKEEAPAPLTADAIAKLVADEVAKALKASKANDKKTKDEDEEEVEKMLGDEDPDAEEAKDEDPDAEKETDDEDPEEEKEANDAAFASIVKAMKPVYDTLPKKEQKKVRDQLVSLKKKPTADAYAGILKAIKSHATKDNAPVQNADAGSVSDRVMAERNPHYKK